jgi:hypothetical protein
MAPVFELFAVAVFVTAATLFVLRVLRTDPPLKPYAIVACASAVGGWLAAHGVEMIGLGLTVGAAFHLLQVALYPAREPEPAAPREHPRAPRPL